MKSSFKAAAALIGLGTAVAMAACGSPAAPASDPDPDPTNRIEPNLTPAGVEAIVHLGETLFPAIQAATAETANPVYSPLSVYLALGMVGHGARGATADQFAQVLGADRTGVAQAAGGVFEDYDQFATGAADQPIVRLADSVWIDQTLEVEDAFKRDLAEIYQSDVQQVDFGAKGSAKPINDWVSDKTGGLIKEILNQQQASETVDLFLANALYFKGAWPLPANPHQTAPADFETADGDSVRADTMTFSNISGGCFISPDGAEGALLGYGDGRFAMLAVMPAGGVDAIDWDGGVVAEWLAQVEDSEALTVKLPKWEADSGKLALKSILLAAGLEDAFDAGLADFGGIADDALFLSQVNHRAVVKVDEAGTEAAAVTGSEMSITSLPSEPIAIEFDRAFVYSILDTATGLPLFLGVVNDPTA
ncbi:MAG: hypothetical protein LBD70_05980 [Bifidobacteriaceae bacterium]|jgi:serpin B|nr:hypothetical protein [Bifidobacteriaceae bacterium]